MQAAVGHAPSRSSSLRHALVPSSPVAVTDPASPSAPASPPRPVTAPSVPRAERSLICAFCGGDALRNSIGKPEQLVSCWTCGDSGHPGCLNWQDASVTRRVSSYHWACVNCKTCSACDTKDDDDDILLCDSCDRGWHQHCLVPPMLKVPKKFTCPTCQSSTVFASSSTASLSSQRPHPPPSGPFSLHLSTSSLPSAPTPHDPPTEKKKHPNQWTYKPKKDTPNGTPSAPSSHKGKARAVDQSPSYASTEQLPRIKLPSSSIEGVTTPSSSTGTRLTFRFSAPEGSNGDDLHSPSSAGDGLGTVGSEFPVLKRRGRPPKVPRPPPTLEEYEENLKRLKERAADRARSALLAPEDDYGDCTDEEGGGDVEEPYGGILDGVQREVGERQPLAEDRKRWENARDEAEHRAFLDFALSSAAAPSTPVAAPSTPTATLPTDPEVEFPGRSLASGPSFDSATGPLTSRLADTSSLPLVASSPSSTNNIFPFPQPPLPGPLYKTTSLPNFDAQSLSSALSLRPSRAPSLAVASAPPTPGGSSILTSVPIGEIKSIRFGEFEITTWYQAPFPEEFSRVPEGRLWICEFCLKYMKGGFQAGRHRLKCKTRHPPGDEIYHDGQVSVFEVDGRKNKIYCQNLCLLAKMFLDHKTLYYDVEPFLFYVMTTADATGARFVGYFSKEKRSPTNNVSCIMTLPVRQRQGWGNLLINFSYLLSKKEGRLGTPERPLSDLGLLSYRNYWTLVLFQYLGSVPPQHEVTIEEISAKTALTPEDIYFVLSERDMITDLAAISLPLPDTLVSSSLADPARPSSAAGTRTSSGNQWAPRKRSNKMATATIAGSSSSRPHQDDLHETPPVIIPQSYRIHWAPDVVRAHVEKWAAKNYLQLKPDKLQWSPFLFTRYGVEPPLATPVAVAGQAASEANAVAGPSGAAVGPANGLGTTNSEAANGFAPHPVADANGSTYASSEAEVDHERLSSDESNYLEVDDDDDEEALPPHVKRRRLSTDRPRRTGLRRPDPPASPSRRTSSRVTRKATARRESPNISTPDGRGRARRSSPVNAADATEDSPIPETPDNQSSILELTPPDEDDDGQDPAVVAQNGSARRRQSDASSSRLSSLAPTESDKVVPETPDNGSADLDGAGWEDVDAEGDSVIYDPDLSLGLAF